MERTNDVEMFHDESWKPVYFGVKVTSHKNIASVGLYTLVSAGFFWLLLYSGEFEKTMPGKVIVIVCSGWPTYGIC